MKRKVRDIKAHEMEAAAERALSHAAFVAGDSPEARVFRAACEVAGVPATTAQHRKFAARRGVAWTALEARPKVVAVAAKVKNVVVRPVGWRVNFYVVA